MKLVFLGSPQVAARTLQALVEADHELVAVITQPDKRRGRGTTTSSTPVKAVAQELQLPVFDDIDVLDDINFDAGVVAAYGKLIPKRFVDNHTLVNIHPSLLPRWRGAAPVERAILAGDTETGVCVMKLVMEMDEGPVFWRHVTQIGEYETSAELLDRLFAKGTEMLLELFSSDLPEPEAQTGEPTHAAKLTAEDRHIDWSGSAIEALRKVRVGRAWTTFRGKRLLIHRAARTNEQLAPGTIRETLVGTSTMALALETVQPEGKPAMAATEWSNGNRPEASERLI
jgi:methionyl-tRNA formyltransferase